jgi:hypothetical protein
MNNFFAMISLITISFLTFNAKADWSRDLKPNPLLCAGQDEKDANSKVSVKIQYTEAEGKVGHIIEFKSGDEIQKINVNNALQLQSEGILYIQTVASGLNLAISEGDILALAKDTAKNLTTSSLAYKMEGQAFNKGKRFSMTCIGTFAQ